MTGYLTTGFTIHSLIFLLAVMSVLTILIMRYPEFGIALLSVFPVPLNFIAISIKSSMLVWVAVLTAMSLFRYAHRSPGIYFNRLISNPLLWYVCLLYLLQIISYFFFRTPYNLGKQTLIMGTCYILALIGLLLITPDKGRLKRHLLLVCIIMTIGHLLYLFIFFGNIRTIPQWRIYTSLLGYNIGSAATVSIIGIIIIIYQAGLLRSVWKRFLWICIVLIPAILVILFSGTRIAYIAIIVGLTFFYHHQKNLILKVKFIQVTLILISMFFISSIYVRGIDDSITFVYDRIQFAIEYPKEALSSRLSDFDIAIEQFASSPLFGVGTGSGSLVVDIDPVSPLVSIIYRRSIHNEFLKIAAERGIVGLVLYILLYITAFRHALAAIACGRNNLAFQLGLIVASGLLMSLTLGMTGNSPMLYWLLGVSYAAKYWFQRQLETPAGDIPVSTSNGCLNIIERI